MRSFVFVLVFVALAASVPTYTDVEEEFGTELVQESPEDDLMQVVQKLRSVTPSKLKLTSHLNWISKHAELVQKAKAYSHNFSKSKAAIAAALKSLHAQLDSGHTHDVNALKSARVDSAKRIGKAQTDGKVKTHGFRNKACPTKRAEEAADAKKKAAKSRMDAIKAEKICSKNGMYWKIPTTWGDMDVDKSTPKFGTELRNAWDKTHGRFVAAKNKHDAAVKAHSDAVNKHKAAMASFKTALRLEVSNADTGCKYNHKEYNQLKAEVASNVASRKQVYIATLVVKCYVDNISSNAGAKSCADRARGASTSKFNINGGSLSSCPSKDTLAKEFGPEGWMATPANCKSAIEIKYIYKGCYSHKGQNLLNFVRNSSGKIDRSLTWNGCAAKAKKIVAEWFGEEYPAGDAKRETASCGMPRSRDPYPGVWDATSEGKIPDSKCGPVVDGHRMGGAFAIALYVKAH